MNTFVAGAGPGAPSWWGRARNHALNRALAMIGSAAAPAYLWRCDRVGLRARTLGKPRVVNHGRIEIGDDVTIDSRESPVELNAGPGARIAIGSQVSVGPGTVLAASSFVEVGDRATIGPRCTVRDGDDPAEAKPVWIGDDVTLGAGVQLLPGATVGAGSSILAGSVVAGAIPPGVVAGGSPALPVAAPERAAAAAERAGTPERHPLDEGAAHPGSGAELEPARAEPATQEPAC